MKLTTLVASIAAFSALAVVASTGSVHAEEANTQTTEQPKIVEVVKGDSLSKIAKANESTYVRIYDANVEVKDPDVIYPGQKVRIPKADEQLVSRGMPAEAPAPKPASKVQAKKPAAKKQAAAPKKQATKPIASTAPAVANGSVWDRLAQCESGGNWAINTGNGYYGGLQFLPATWRGVGGTGLPHQNSREEQIKRAEILLARSGWGQWPACAKKLGLL